LDEALKSVSVVEKIDVKRYAQLLVEYERSISYRGRAAGGLS
jgi:hypothetical protein